MQQLVITRYKGGVASSLFQGQELIQVHVEKEAEKSLLGNVYVGKVKNIVKNINAAFVEVENGQMCYLPLTEKTSPIFCNAKNNEKICIGDELLVQISKDAVKTKNPSVTTKLQLLGKYIILTYGDPRVSVSAKIGDKVERERLLQLVKSNKKKKASYGLIVRTNANGCKEEEILQELQLLEENFNKLVETGKYKSCFSKLYQAPAGYLCDIRDGYAQTIDKIVTDDDTLYQRLFEYLSAYQPTDVDKLSLYKDDMVGLQQIYGIDTKIEKALQERVWLKSGAYLVIQPTEALTVIDVNTGKAVDGKKVVEKHFLHINKEAAVEIAKQMRLRNLSGIIVVDFIDMEAALSKKELIQTLEEELQKDTVKTVFVEMTKLHLVEITRKKVRKPLAEQIKALEEHGSNR